MSFHGVLDALRPINPESTPELANSVNGSTKSSSFKKPTNERERTQDQWPLVMQRLKKQNKKFKNKKTKTTQHRQRYKFVFPSLFFISLKNKSVYRKNDGTNIRRPVMDRARYIRNRYGCFSHIFFFLQNYLPFQHSFLLFIQFFYNTFCSFILFFFVDLFLPYSVPFWV